MTLFPETRKAIAAYRAAIKALRDNAAAERSIGINWETREFHRLSDEVWASVDALPWWLRWVVL